jgi:hypothetical protein
MLMMKQVKKKSKRIFALFERLISFSRKRDSWEKMIMSCCTYL